MTVKFYLRDLEKGHKASVYLDYYYKGTRFRAPAGIKVNKKEWNGSRLKPRAKDANSINLKLSAIESRLIEIASKLEYPTADQVKAIYFQNKSESFFDAWRIFDLERIQQLKINTQKRYQTTYNDLKQFSLQYHINLKDLNESFFQGFKIYLKQKGNIDNTISRKLKDVKSFLNYCYKKKWIEDRVWDYWKTGIKPTEDRLYLTEEELSQMYLFPYPKQVHKKVSDLFRFHCETGLRYSDGQSNTYLIANILHFKNVKANRSGKIRLTPIALEIWNRYDGLPKISNQKFNKYIKESAKIAGIDSMFYVKGKLVPKFEKITTHEGRATFITRLLNKGVPINVVSKLVGHTSVKTTMKYDRTSEGKAFEFLDLL